jgi:hypothetical protein
MRSLATSITGSGGSNKDEMQRAYSRGETLHQGVVSSIALASVSSSTGEKKGKLLPGQTFEMSPSMRAAWQADQSDRNRCALGLLFSSSSSFFLLCFSSFPLLS